MRTLLISLAACASGCVLNGDKWPRPRDLTPTWQVDKTRILGIRAEPPEAVPGQVVTFSALFGHPPDAEPDQSVVWLACPVDDEGNGFGCLTDISAFDLEQPDPAALAELGVIGFEPGLPPTYRVPDDLLDGLDEETRVEGSYVLAQALALPNELLEAEAGSVDEIDFGVVISAYKRLVVSEAITPNANPAIGAFTVDGFPVPPDVPVRIEAGQSYELGLLLDDEARQTYTFFPSEGPPEERVEEPYASWFTTGGTLFEQVTLWPYMEATWTADGGPKAEGKTGFWYVVLRDRRGGMSWHTQEWIVGSPTR